MDKKELRELAKRQRREFKDKRSASAKIKETLLDLPEMKESELAECFPEMRGYIGGCRYSDCSHTHEPDCTIKQAVDSGDIAGRRYDSYIDIYNELREKRRY